MKTRFLVAVLVSLSSTLAFAGKEHREQFKSFEPKVAETMTAVKQNCGCAIKVSVDKASFEKVANDKVKEIASNIGYELTNVAEKTKEFCNDKESKALACKNMKQVVIHSMSGSDAVTEHSGTTMKISTTFQSNSGGYKMKEIMDAW
jgi:hypothetical protein